MPDRCDGSPFCSLQGTTSAMYSMYFSEERHRSGRNGTRPSGLRPKWSHAVLLVTHLGQPNYTPRALPGTIWDSNAVTWQVLTGPKEPLINPSFRAKRSQPPVIPDRRSRIRNPGVTICSMSHIYGAGFSVLHYSGANGILLTCSR